MTNCGNSYVYLKYSYYYWSIKQQQQNILSTINCIIYKQYAVHIIYLPVVNKIDEIVLNIGILLFCLFLCVCGGGGGGGQGAIKHIVNLIEGI